MNTFNIRLRNIFLLIILIILLIIVLFPIFWMVSSSLKTEDEIFSSPPKWLPTIFTLDNYRQLFDQFRFSRYLINSLLVATGATIISMLIGLPAAYGFSRFKFPGSNILLLGVLLIRLFTPAALVVPFYRLLSWMHLIDSLFAIMLCVTVINLPFVLYLMKVFFDDFPIQLEEAASIDGCSNFYIFLKMVIPCSLPSILTSILFSFSMGWSDFLFGLSFSQTIKSAPATVAVASMITGQKVYWGVMLAGGTILSIPIVLLTLLFQKYFVKGLTMGAIKE